LTKEAFRTTVGGVLTRTQAVFPNLRFGDWLEKRCNLASRPYWGQSKELAVEDGLGGCNKKKNPPGERGILVISWKLKGEKPGSVNEKIKQGNRTP